MSMLRPYDWTRAPDDNEAPRPPQPPRKGQFFRWLVIAINILFLVWLISAFAHGSSCTGLTADELNACQTGEAVGVAIGAFLILGVWAFVDVILGVVYLVLRDRR